MKNNCTSYKNLKEKFLLDESDSLPDIEIEEPISISTDSNDSHEPNEENDLNAFVSLLNSAISNEWNQIETVKSYITTIDSINNDNINKEDITLILNQIVDEKTMHVGMYQKAIELLDITPSNLVDKGEDKAEELIEPLKEN